MGFNVLGAVKFVTSGIVALGAGKITGQIIKNNIATPETLIDKVAVLGASWAMGGIVAKATKAHTNETIDDIHAAGVGVVNMVKQQAKLSRINNGSSTFEKEGLKQENFVKEADGKWHPIKVVDVTTNIDAEHIAKVNKITDEAKKASQ